MILKLIKGEKKKILFELGEKKGDAAELVLGLMFGKNEDIKKAFGGVIPEIELDDPTNDELIKAKGNFEKAFKEIFK